MKKVIAIVLALLLCSCAAAESEDWYLTVAMQQTEKLGELVNDEAYLADYSYDCLDRAKAVDFSQVADAYRIQFDAEKALDHEIEEQGGGEYSDLVREKMLQFVPKYMVAGIRNAQGAEALVASSLVCWSETFVRPLNFSPCIYVLELDGLSVITTFIRTGDDTITVESAPFFTNGDNTSFMKEIDTYMILNWKLDIDQIL